MIHSYSIFGGGDISFTAVYKDAKKYTWYIGADTLYTRTINRFFDKQFIGQTIPVTLIVEYEPNTLCDKSNGRDTLTKTIKLIDGCTFNTTGKYRTALEGTKDSFEWEWIPSSIRSNDIFVGLCQVESGLDALIGLMNYLEPANTEFRDTLNVQGVATNSKINMGTFRTGGALLTYRINENITLAFGGSMITGDADRSKPIGGEGGNPNVVKGYYDNCTESLFNLRAGTMFGGVILQGQAYFIGHNSENRLHAIQNFIHREITKITPYFEDRMFQSKSYGYFGSYHPNYLYY